MKVYIGADHRGFGLKKKIIAMLEQLGHKVIDLGTYTDQQPCDYPDVAKDVGEHVAKERDARGILVCMSGIGLTIAANKVKGVYAALCYNLEAAELSRLHNNANVLVLSAKFIDEKDIFQMLETWMTTPFEGGRHLARVKKIMDMEERSSPATKADAPAEHRERPQASSEESSERRPERRERPGRSDRPTYSTRKPPFRKDERREYSGPRKSFSKEGERSYGSHRSDDRREARSSYDSRRDERGGGSRDEGRSYPPRKPYRRDEGSSSGPRKNYGERSYGRPARPAGRGDDRPSYASRRPDDRKMSDRQRPAYAKDRPAYSKDRPAYSKDRPAYSKDRPSYSKDRPAYSKDRPAYSKDRPDRKPFSSGKPKFGSKPFGKSSSGPRKKFERS